MPQDPLPDALFRQAFDSASVGMAIVDLHGTLCYVNPLLARMVGRAPEALRERPFDDLLHPSDRHAYTFVLESAGRQRRDLPCGELRMRSADNAYQWYRLNLRLIEDARGDGEHCLVRIEPTRNASLQSGQFELLSFALDYSHDGVLLLDDELTIRYLNRSASTLLGHPQSSLLDMPLSFALPPLARLPQKALLELVSGSENLNLELPRPDDGTRLQLSLQFSGFRHERRGYSLALVRDLTEQRRLEDVLRYNEEQFRALIENTPDAIGRLTPDFHLIYANPALEALCTLPLAEARGRPAHEAFGYNAQVDIMADLVRQVADSGEAMEEELVYGADGPPERQVHYLVQLVPERNAQGEICSIISLARDISGIRNAERRLAESNRQLRALTRRRESAREEERKLIAREIHDELGQHLTALRMGISLLRLQFGEQLPELGTHIEQLMGLCDRTIEVVRFIATSLRPSTLNMGLLPALEWLVKDFQTHTRIHSDLRVGNLPQQPLNDAQTTIAFRIVQEALTNVARHAKANHVTVNVSVDDGQVQLDITDDGRGFDPSRSQRTCLGLAGMRERGLSLGGEVVIFSHPGQGTTVQARFPVREPEEQR